MKSHKPITIGAVFVLLFTIVSLPVSRAAFAQQDTPKDFVPPIIFQAAGPTAASIQDSVAEYRIALGATDNRNNPGPLDINSGHREINWDGGNPNNVATAISGTPFAGFQVTRGALFTTDGTGFVQAPPAGLAAPNVFDNPTYETIFKAFSPSRLFSAIGSNLTEVEFFVPGPDNGDKRAAVKGFGAVFTDVDLPDGGGPGRKHQASTKMDYFDAEGNLLFSGTVPASPGDGSFSFLGIVFQDARIARVLITSGNTVPGRDDGGKRDVVMMDDFLYGEPQPLP